jgi:hypothetical protein
VAVIALIAGRDMIYRFAHCALIVMTAVTRTEHFKVIHAYDRRPGAGAMTRFAALRHDVMRWRLRSRPHSPGVRMATGTIYWSPNEHTVDMATRTLAELMRSIETKTSREVIELRCNRSL